ncbi:hypothetical protein J6590_023656 [Homalodisca vitripennis]|nr:hypothetical protein J6590_023656 [Homalodisca vitripennis]
MRARRRTKTITKHPTVSKPSSLESVRGLGMKIGPSPGAAAEIQARPARPSPAASDYNHDLDNLCDDAAGGGVAESA